MFFRKGKRELFFSAAQEREAGQETHFPRADLLQCRRIPDDFLEMSIEVQIHDEFFMRTSLRNAEKLGGFSGTNGSGQKYMRNTKGTIQRVADGFHGTQRPIGTPCGLLRGHFGIEALK